MQRLVIKALMISAMLVFVSPAIADDAGVPKPEAREMMKCPMMGNMDQMQKDMTDMMQEMDSMIMDMSDSAMKERMQKMHEQMGVMMSHMQGMSGDMGGMMGGMMGKGMAAPRSGEDVKNSTESSPEDHSAHHPDGGK